MHAQNACNTSSTQDFMHAMHGIDGELVLNNPPMLNVHTLLNNVDDLIDVCYIMLETSTEKDMHARFFTETGTPSIGDALLSEDDRGYVFIEKSTQLDESRSTTPLASDCCER